MRAVSWARAAVLVMVFLPGRAAARTWRVLNDGSGDAPTIQAGIDSASAGDTVLVGPGTYLEHPDFSGKDIVLKSLSGPALTTLDGSDGAHPWVVGIQNGESQGAILEGFTITGGVGGISIWNSQPTILSNRIVDNLGAGGVVCDSDISLSAPPWRPRILGNTFEVNVSSQNGGGVECFRKYVPEIKGNLFRQNGTTFGDGGGVYLRLTDPGTVISGNRFEQNVAADHGGGIYAGRILTGGASELEISWNVIVGNWAHGRAADFQGGGGIWLKGTNGWVHHNTIVGNSASDDFTAAGGGICLVDEVSATIEQNIIAFSPVGDAIGCFSSSSVLRNNLVWSSLPENIGTLCVDYWSGNGNIVADPQFCDTTGDFSVASTSPAITHPAGPLGALPIPGCTGTAAQRTTWGLIKAKFGS